MDMSSSSAASLTRPRLTLAVITAVAAASVGIYLFREARSPAADPPPGQGLHRSNAVRRPRRRSRARNRRGSNTSASSSSESHTDENIDIHTVPMQTEADTVGNETFDDNWWDDPSQMPLQRAGQNIVGLLFRVSSIDEQASRAYGLHDQFVGDLMKALPARDRSRLAGLKSVAP